MRIILGNSKSSKFLKEKVSGVKRKRERIVYLISLIMR